MAGSSRADGLSLFSLQLVNRKELFAALFVVGCINGFFSRVITAVDQTGLWKAVGQTFGISVIVWAACLAGVSLILRHKSDAINSADLLVCLVVLCLFAIPFSPLSWVAVAGLAVYSIRFSEPVSPLRRGSLILLAVTVPMLWTRVLFALFSEPLLKIDAFFVSSILGTERIGNVVAFADGSGYLQIFQGCSSFDNLSLALLAWVTLSQCAGHRWRHQDLIWYFLSCLSIIVVNVSRISLIGLYPEHIGIIHGPIGSAVASWLTLSVIVLISLFGVRRDLFARV
jgi:exosortase/archaeosortase family protein